MNFEMPQINTALRDHKNFVQGSLEELRAHDQKTHEHSVEVGSIMVFVVREMKNILSERERTILLNAALLHDLGKIGVEAEILNKEGELSQEERRKIRLHPKIGFDALRKWDLEVAKVVVAHHEHQRYAYPREWVVGDMQEKRFSDAQTDKLSRILAMVDAFQAMLADRPGKNNKPKTIDQTVSELQNNFVLPEDQRVIMLLEAYYWQGHRDERANDN